jgi:uncharacterized Zn-binding protein involved in type VI secretion
MPPAARITDFHACPMVTPGTPPIPHVGGPIMKGSHNVLTGKLPQARVGDMAVCVGPMDVIVKGSSGVFVNKMPAARIGDQTAHGGTIVAGFPTVIIGETKAGGGGGVALPNTAAVQFAYTEVIQQLQVLIDAWKTAAPFCEACFRAASKAGGPTAAPSTPPSAPPSSPASARAGSNELQSAPSGSPAVGPVVSRAVVTSAPVTICEVSDLRISCSHGRAAGPEGILCVVPAGTTWSDKISGQLSTRGGCATHPAWKVSGAASDGGKGLSLRFDATAAKRQPSRHIVMTPAPDHATYRVSAEGCGGSVLPFEVHAYPPEEVSVTVDFMDAVKSLKSFFTRTGLVLDGKGKREFDFLHGSVTYTGKWEEHSDWRCYMEHKIAGGFNPLLAGELRFPFLKAVPPPLSKIVELKAYVTVKGSCQISASMVWESWPYPKLGGQSTVWKTNLVEGGGEFRFGLGAAASVGEEVSISIEGTCGGSLSASPAHQAYPAAKIKWALGDGRFDVEVEFPFGIEMNFGTTLWPGFSDDGEWRFDRTTG